MGGAGEARLLDDLLGELVGGREDERDGPVALAKLVLRHDVREGGQHEGRRLARARRGDTDHVATTQRDGQRLALDGCWLLVAVPAHLG